MPEGTMCLMCGRAFEQPSSTGKVWDCFSHIYYDENRDDPDNHTDEAYRNEAIRAIGEVT